MVRRCRCVATVSRAVNNDRVGLSCRESRRVATAASSSPCRPQRLQGSTGIDCRRRCRRRRRRRHRRRWRTCSTVLVSLNRASSAATLSPFPGFSRCSIQFNLVARGVVETSLSIGFDRRVFLSPVSLSPEEVDFNFRRTETPPLSPPLRHPIVPPCRQRFCSPVKTTYLPVTQFPGASIERAERRGAESNVTRRSR